MNVNSAHIINAYYDVYEQYLNEASFLWEMRSIAVRQPHYYPDDIAELEERIQAQLDALMTEPEMAWRICEQALALEGPGEVFVATVVAINSRAQDRIQKSVEAGLTCDEAFPGLVSAFGWLPADFSHPWIEKFLNSKEINHKYLALAICSIRRENPGQYLYKYMQREDCIQHKYLYCRALRLIGELKLWDLSEALNTAMSSDDNDVVFWASWSSLMLGNKYALARIESYVFEQGIYQNRAIDTVFRVLPMEQAREWISRMSSDTAQQRAAIRAVGVLGDPQAIDWLIEKSQENHLSRAAGEAFWMITGIDLDDNDVSRDQPEDFQNSPNDEVEDDNVEIDVDENLSWPDPGALAMLWKSVTERYLQGNRYFLGCPVEPRSIIQGIQSAQQRHRNAAALELALMDVQEILYNIRSKVGV